MKIRETSAKIMLNMFILQFYIIKRYGYIGDFFIKMSVSVL